MSIPLQTNPSIQYVAFDKKTGQIVHVHTRLSAVKNAYVEVPLDELKQSLSKDASILSRLSGADPANLDVIQTDPKSPLSGRLGRMTVDLKTRVLVEKPSLSLKADKTEIVGDGQDSVKIAIHAVDQDGKPVRGLDDKLKVVTSRGKLSAQGGLVHLVQGHATVTLTSVNETVSRVVVRASSIAGACSSGEVRLEFV
jgi:hypothetical protein